MEYDDYLRIQAEQYRQLAEKAENIEARLELLHLAAVCDEAANNKTALRQVEGGVSRLQQPRWAASFRLDGWAISQVAHSPAQPGAGDGGAQAEMKRAPAHRTQGPLRRKRSVQRPPLRIQVLRVARLIPVWTEILSGRKTTFWLSRLVA